MKTFYNKYLKYHKKYFRLYNKLQLAGALDTKSINIDSLIEESENVIKSQVQKAKSINIDDVINVVEKIKEKQKKDAEPGFFSNIFTKVAEVAENVGTEASKLKDAVISKVEDASDEASKMVKSASVEAGKLKDAVVTKVEDTKKSLEPALKEASDKTSKMFKEASDEASKLKDAVVTKVEDTKKSLEPALKEASKMFKEASEEASKLKDELSTKVEDVKKSLEPALKDASDKASKMFKDASDEASKMAKSANAEMSKLKDELASKVEDAKKSLEPALKEASKMLETASSEASRMKNDIMQSASNAKQVLDKTLATATTMADSIKNEFAELKEKASTVKTDIMQKIQSELGPLQASILGNLNNEFNKVSSATNNINSQYKDIEEKVTVMKSEMSNNMDTVNNEVRTKITEAVTGEMDKVTKSIEIFKSRYEEMNKQIAEVQGKFDALSQSEMQKLQGQMDMMMGQMKGQVEAQLVEMKNKISISLPPTTNQELLTKVETLNAYVSNLNLSTINQQLDSLNRAVHTDMKMALDNMNQQIYNIGIMNNNNNNNNNGNEMGGKLEKLQHMVEELQIKNNDTKIENLQSDVEKLKSIDNNSLKSSVAGLQDEVSRIGAYIQRQASTPQEHVAPVSISAPVSAPQDNIKQVVENLDTNSKEINITLDNLRKDLDAVKLAQASNVVSNTPMQVTSPLNTMNDTFDKLSEQVKSLEEKANKVPELERKIEEILARLNNQPIPNKEMETLVKEPVSEKSTEENKSLVDKLKETLQGDSSEMQSESETKPEQPEQVIETKVEQPKQVDMVDKLKDILVSDTESPNLFMNYLSSKKSKK